MTKDSNRIDPEDAARIERALAPSRGITDIMKAISLANEIRVPWQPTAITELAKSMQPPTHLTAVSQLMIALRREHQSIAALARPTGVLDELTSQMTQMRAIGDRITAPYKAFQEVMRSQASVFERLTPRVAALDANKLGITAFSQATLAWDVAAIGLANRMKDIGLLARREALCGRLFEVHSTYSEFVRKTTERLETGLAPTIAARLRGSLNLAEHQLLGIADAVGGFVTPPEDDQEPDAVRTLAAPFAQQDELLHCEFLEDDSDTAALTSASSTAQTVQLARRVLELLTQCNEAGKTSSLGTEIFKPTTRLLVVFCDLPWLSSPNRLRFGDVIDCLYFIFYEGAGQDGLRFLKEHGGPLTDAECDLIWCIKHLRNKWSRHDADHGKEKNIKKSWAELAAKFRWLGLSEHPTEARHFQLLHHNLLESAESFLDRLLQKLTLKP